MSTTSKPQNLANLMKCLGVIAIDFGLELLNQVNLGSLGSYGQILGGGDRV